MTAPHFEFDTIVLSAGTDEPRIVFEAPDGRIVADPDAVVALCPDCDGFVKFAERPVCPECDAELAPLP